MPLAALVMHLSQQQQQPFSHLSCLINTYQDSIGPETPVYAAHLGISISQSINQPHAIMPALGEPYPRPTKFEYAYLFSNDLTM
jgi:hypothetical protein